MHRNDFWNIIDKVKSQENKANALASELQQLTTNKLAAYQELFDDLFDNAYQWDLWGAAYVIGGGCSDDGFIDFRYGLISSGKDIYENALADPDSLSALGAGVEVDDESFGYVASQVYKKLFDREIPRKKSSGSGDPSGEEWDFDDEKANRERLPKLMSLHW